MDNESHTQVCEETHRNCRECDFESEPQPEGAPEEGLSSNAETRAPEDADRAEQAQVPKSLAA